MGYKRSRKKLEKYLERDDFPKLKSYLTKHPNIDVNKLRLAGGDTLLHLACRRGLDHAVWFLLKRGADPLVRNDQEEVPLHASCLFALNESHYAYYDLVMPYVDKAPRALSCEDKNGITPRDLIRRIRQKLSQKGAKINEDERWSDSSNEEDWSEKLAEEADDEYGGNWGKYENDFVDAEMPDERETYDAWADRLQNEMSQKRRRQQEQQRGSQRKKQKTEEEKAAEAERQAEFQRSVEREHEEYMNRAVKIRQRKMVARKANYNLRCAEVFQSDNQSDTQDLGYEDLPWPTPSNWDKLSESMKEFLLCDLDTQDKAAIKKYLKDQQVRWHPDRFKQKCGNRLKAKDTNRIMDRVKLISQTLNNLVSEMQDV